MLVVLVGCEIRRRAQRGLQGVGGMQPARVPRGASWLRYGVVRAGEKEEVLQGGGGWWCGRAGCGGGFRGCGRAQGSGYRVGRLGRVTAGAVLQGVGGLAAIRGGAPPPLS